MSGEEVQSKLALSKGFINLNDVMDVRMAVKNPVGPEKESGGAIQLVEGGKGKLCRPFSQGHSHKGIFRYFTLEAMCLLMCLTMSLLILPLILPPLPPPPFLLLLLPIGILALLVFLACMPSDARNAAASAYV